MSFRVTTTNLCFSKVMLVTYLAFLVGYLIWFVHCHFIRFMHTGLVCAGEFLDDEDVAYVPGYAIKQSAVVLYLIETQWVALVSFWIIYEISRLCFWFYAKARA